MWQRRNLARALNIVKDNTFLEAFPSPVVSLFPEVRCVARVEISSTNVDALEGPFVSIISHQCHPTVNVTGVSVFHEYTSRSLLKRHAIAVFNTDKVIEAVVAS